jgi:hypothetical protein
LHCTAVFPLLRSFYLFLTFLSSSAAAPFYRFLAYSVSSPDVARQLDMPLALLFQMLSAYLIIYQQIPAWIRYSVFWVTPVQSVRVEDDEREAPTRGARSAQ